MSITMEELTGQAAAPVQETITPAEPGQAAPTAPGPADTASTGQATAPDTAGAQPEGQAKAPDQPMVLYKFNDGTVLTPNNFTEQISRLEGDRTRLRSDYDRKMAELKTQREQFDLEKQAFYSAFNTQAQRTPQPEGQAQAPQSALPDLDWEPIEAQWREEGLPEAALKAMKAQHEALQAAYRKVETLEGGYRKFEQQSEATQRIQETAQTWRQTRGHLGIDDETNAVVIGRVQQQLGNKFLDLSPAEAEGVLLKAYLTVQREKSQTQPGNTPTPAQPDNAALMAALEQVRQKKLDQAGQITPAPSGAPATGVSQNVPEEVTPRVFTRGIKRFLQEHNAAT